MESSSKDSTAIKSKKEDIDLGLVFYQTGNFISNFFRSLSRMFSAFGNVLLMILFFLRNNILWIIFGTAIGLGYGAFMLVKTGSKYSSDLTLRTNFNSSRTLYDVVSFINSMISSDRTNELADVLNISKAEAASLVYFEAEPVKSEIITVELYRDQFFKNIRNEKIRTDTFWTNTIKYNDFKSSLTKYDYPLHVIHAISNSSTVFPKLQGGIISQINQNQLFQQLKTNAADIRKEEIDLLNTSIQSLDTLRQAYSKRIASTVTSEKGGGNNITMMDVNAFKNPELDLYDKLLELKDELKNVKSQYILDKNIIEVYSSFNAMGKKESFFRQSIVRYSILGFTMTIIILASIRFYFYLGRLEASKKNRPRLVTK